MGDHIISPYNNSPGGYTKTAVCIVMGDHIISPYNNSPGGYTKTAVCIVRGLVGTEVKEQRTMTPYVFGAVR